MKLFLVSEYFDTFANISQNFLSYGGKTNAKVFMDILSEAKSIYIPKNTAVCHVRISRTVVHALKQFNTNHKEVTKDKTYDRSQKCNPIEIHLIKKNVLFTYFFFVFFVFFEPCDCFRYTLFNCCKFKMG